MDHAIALREQADLVVLLRALPGLLAQATTYAYAAASPEAWALLAEVYSVTYYLAARHRWMDFVEIALAHQEWAAGPQPLLRATATVQRTGAFLNGGDFEGGLTVVDRTEVIDDLGSCGEPVSYPCVEVRRVRQSELIGRQPASGRRFTESPPTPLGGYQVHENAKGPVRIIGGSCRCRLGEGTRR